MKSIASFGRLIAHGLTRLGSATDGAAAIYVTMLLPVLIGGALLTVDASRLYSLHAHLQASADALALAGAAELDGQPNSITRANRAMGNLVTNYSRFGNSGRTAVNIGTTTFLSSLPTSDATAVSATTTNPLQARYVQVQTAAVNFTTIFPATFVGAASNATSTKAIATAGGPLAGKGRQICLGPVAPMFICNPYEGSGTTIFQATDSTDSNYGTNRRRQIKLQAGNSTFYPGNFGWLDTPELGHGATALRDALALVNPVTSDGTCYVQRNTVSQSTGNVSNADDAINTRFDLWAGPFNNAKNNAAYQPAANTRKGWYKPGNACNADDKNDDSPPPSPPSNRYKNNKLGRDITFNGRLGSGIWDFDCYWTNNYGGSYNTTDPNNPRCTPSNAPNGWSNSNLPSRYDVYAYELANNLAGNAAAQGNAAGEKGTPLCSNRLPASNVPDRRVIHVALINCTAVSVNGNSSDLGAPFAYGKFFLTEPVTKPTDATCPTCIFAELIGLSGTGATIGSGDGSNSGSSAVVSESVQLYR